MITLSDIENTLTQQGSFCLLDWLLQHNQILYTDYEQWRYGKIDYLESKIEVEPETLMAVNESVKTLSKKLHLEPQKQEYYSWSEQPQPLHVSKNRDRHSELTQRWLRPQDLPQMDLFMDNAAIVAENALLDSLTARQFGSAQTYLDKLTTLNPAHDKLGQYQDLINYGHHMHSQNSELATINAEIEGLENEVAPLAKMVLRQGARDYLAFAWRRLADGLSTQAFDPQQVKLHRSYALMQIPDWKAAFSCLSEGAEYHQQPTLLLRMAQCLEALKKHQQALLCWCLFMELDETRCEAAIEAKASPMVWELWQDFWELSAELPAAFFPAYLFLRQPGLIHHLQKIPPLQGSATVAVIEVLQARVKTEDDMPYRKKLQSISPVLLQLLLNP